MMNPNCFLSFLYKKKARILDLVLSNFIDIELFPVIGLEIEFYLIKDNKPASEDKILNKFISEFSIALDKHQPIISKIEKEQGLSQLEVKTASSSQIQKVCDNLLLIKRVSKELAENSGLDVNFRAQPFTDDCGSALQINLSFVDRDGNNLFAKNDSEESKLLLNSVGGILELIDQLMIFSVSNPKDYRRYNLELNLNLFKNKKYTAPVNVSWGYDNRTALIRIPRSIKEEERRLEFRLPAASADIYLIIISLLIAIKHGIDNKICPPKAIYGNAFDSNYIEGDYIDNNYNLKPLIDSKVLAREKFFSPNPILNGLKELLVKAEK